VRVLRCDGEIGPGACAAARASIESLPETVETFTTFTTVTRRFSPLKTRYVFYGCQGYNELYSTKSVIVQQDQIRIGLQSV
jgi:hypothetical protein